MLKFLLEKEFKQLFRHTFIPKLIIIMPIMVMLIFPWVANQSIKNIRLSIVDYDHSSFSERLTNKLTASGFFKLANYPTSNEEAMYSVEAGNSDVIFEIPLGFERELYQSGTAQVMISANAVNGMKGGLGGAYLSSIVNDFTTELSAEQGLQMQLSLVHPQFKFNPMLDYKAFLIPALFVMLLTLLVGFLPALNIVSEKEIGTTEQLNVTPMNKAVFILAKLIPYWIVGIIILTIAMGLASLIYGLSPASYATIYLYTVVYTLAVSGLGIIISNHSETMQQAMFVMFFFMLIIILLSGLYTPVSSMPSWAQVITAFNPLTYFMEVMRAVYLKGSALKELLPQFFILCGFAVVINIWAVFSYKKSH